MKSTRIAIFASGNGTNAVNLIQYFKENTAIEVAVLLVNKPDAPVVHKAKELGIETLYFDNESFENGLTVLQELDYRAVSWIVLAGFLRKLPVNLINGFQDHIINIHPSLLPKFGGKGMYGMHVHRAVVEAGEKKSGISIHFVNEHFDEGKLIAQFETILEATDTPEHVAEKIHRLEAEHFPYIVEQTILKNA